MLPPISNKSNAEMSLRIYFGVGVFLIKAFVLNFASDLSCFD